MKELLSVEAEDVDAFCIYDTENEVFIKAFRSCADVYEDDIIATDDNVDADPDNYYCWDYEAFGLENIDSTYEDGADVTIGLSGLKVSHVEDTIENVVSETIGLALNEANVVVADNPRFVLIKWYPTGIYVEKQNPSFKE